MSSVWWLLVWEFTKLDTIVWGKVSDFRGESRCGAGGNSGGASGGGNMGYKRDPFMGYLCDPFMGHRGDP